MEIYISLTTVPVRMEEWESSKQNLMSLLTQNTNKDYKVILNVPYNYKNNDNENYVISENLLKLAEENNKLIINRVTNDYGPVVKITGVLPVSKNDDDILIICDDDHVYHEDMLEYHLKKQEQYTNSAIAFRGDVPIEKREWEEDGIKKYVLRTTHFYFPVKHDLRLLIPGHWHSVSYRRKFFKEDFLDEEFLSLSNNDDILVGYYFKKNRIPIICATWDKETDYRPVNDYGRGSWSFPIKFPLPFPSSGFDEFRKKSGSGYGKTNIDVEKFMGNHDIIYIEN